MSKLKSPKTYVTFKLTGEELVLFGTRDGVCVFVTDENYIKYGFKLASDPDEPNYYQLIIDTRDKVELFTNAYDLHYEAIYQGERFGALVNPEKSTIVLWYANASEPSIKGFTRTDKYCWEKIVDISEVELLTIKEPINLLDYLD